MKQTKNCKTQYLPEGRYVRYMVGSSGPAQWGKEWTFGCSVPNIKIWLVCIIRKCQQEIVLFQALFLIFHSRDRKEKKKTSMKFFLWGTWALLDPVLPAELRHFTSSTWKAQNYLDQSVDQRVALRKNWTKHRNLNWTLPQFSNPGANFCLKPLPQPLLKFRIWVLSCQIMSDNSGGNNENWNEQESCVSAFQKRPQVCCCLHGKQEDTGVLVHCFACIQNTGRFLTRIRLHCCLLLTKWSKFVTWHNCIIISLNTANSLPEYPSFALQVSYLLPVTVFGFCVNGIMKLSENKEYTQEG